MTSPISWKLNYNRVQSESNFGAAQAGVDITTTADNSKDVSVKKVLTNTSFSDAIHQPSAPGYWSTVTHEPGSPGEFEGLARSIVQEHSRAGASGRPASELSELLMDENLVADCIKKIAPVQKLNKTDITIVESDIITNTNKVLDRRTTNMATKLAYSHLLDLCLTSIGVVAQTQGFVTIDFREEQFPNRQQLLDEVRIVELTSILSEWSPRIDFKVKGMSVGAVIQAIAARFYDLGEILTRTGMLEKKFNDSMVCIRKQMLHAYMEEDERLPEDILDSKELLMMTKNVTLVAAAFEDVSQTVVATPDHRIPSAVTDVYSALKSMKRFQIVSLAEATASMGHYQLTGEHKKVWGSVAFNAIASTISTVIGDFFEQKVVSGVQRFFPEPTYTESLNGLAAQILPEDHIPKLANMARARLEEVDYQDQPGFVNMTINMTPLDLLHYAMSLNDGKVGMIVTSEDEIRFRFTVDTTETNIDLDGYAIFNIHTVFDPQVYIMSQKTKDNVNVKRMEYQSIPESHLAKRILTNKEAPILPGKQPWTRAVSRNINLQFDISRDATATIKPTLSDVLGLYELDNKRGAAIVQPVTNHIMKVTMETFARLEYITGIKEFEGPIGKDDPRRATINRTEDEMRYSREQLAISMGHLVGRLAQSDAGNRIAKRLIQLIRQSNPSEDFKRELRYGSRDKVFLAQVNSRAALYILNVIGVVSFDMHTEMLEIMKRGNYFDYVANKREEGDL